MTRLRLAGLRTTIKTALLGDGRPLPILSGPASFQMLTGPTSLRIYAGLYEIELNKWIRRLVRPHDTVFDIGGQYGYDAIVFAQLTDGRILSVDSDPAMLPIMEMNLARNALSEQVAVRRTLVGDGANGTVSLDGLAAVSFLPGFVKMDIEGAELKAMTAAEHVLKEAHAWLIEVHSRDAERVCIGALASHGYDLEVVNPRRWLPDHRPTAHNRWVIGSR